MPACANKTDGNRDVNCCAAFIYKAGNSAYKWVCVWGGNWVFPLKCAKHCGSINDRIYDKTLLIILLDFKKSVLNAFSSVSLLVKKWFRNAN